MSIENPMKNISKSKSEGEIKTESTRNYEPSPAIKEIRDSKIIFENKITSETKICLIGDGRGMDTEQFLQMGVSPENIKSINYEQDEVDQANEGVLRDRGVEMVQGDAINFEDLERAGIKKESQEVVTLMHVLEVPNIKGDTEKKLIENLYKILKPGGELLVTQYKHKFTKDERDLQEQIGIEKITKDNLEEQFGDEWREKFKEEYGIEWEEGMRYGEISNIRTRGELESAFRPFFDIKIEENDSEFILKLKKGTQERKSTSL